MRQKRTRRSFKRVKWMLGIVLTFLVVWAGVMAANQYRGSISASLMGGESPVEKTKETPVKRTRLTTLLEKLWKSSTKEQNKILFRF